MSKHENKLRLIVMEGAKDYAQKTVEYILKKNKDCKRSDIIIDSICPRFSSGEAKGLISSSVRGNNIYILCDMYNYGLTYTMYGFDNHMSPDDHYQDLTRIVSIVSGLANKVTVIMPMLYEGRQHRCNSRESLDCAIFLQQLASLGVDNIVTFDAHDERVKNSIPLCGFDNISPIRELISAFINNQKDVVLDKDSLLVISPDEGAIPRCINYATKLGLNLGVFYKRRDYSKVVNGKNPIIAHEFLGADVEGKDAIIIDDIISSGVSILDIMQQLKDRGANDIYVFATFGLFTEGIKELDHAYKMGLFERIFITNLTYLPEEYNKLDWLYRVDVSELVADLILTLDNDESMGDLMLNSSNLDNLINTKRKKLLV